MVQLQTEPSARNLLKAVESLKEAGLSGIGNVILSSSQHGGIPSSSPEYLDAASVGSASFSEDSFMIQTTLTDDENDNKDENPAGEKSTPKKFLSTSGHNMNSVSIHIFPESISQLGSQDGTHQSISADLCTVSIASEDIETVDTRTTVKSAAVSIAPPLSVTGLTAPVTDSEFSIDESTAHCATGKDLWAQGNCEGALVEFRKALLGLESLLGTNHLLVSKLYHWMGQIFLRLYQEAGDDNNNNNSQEAGQRRRALADAAVESLAWSLKIRYTQPTDNDETNASKNTNGSQTSSGGEEDKAIEASIEEALQKAWKFQEGEMPLLSSSRTQRSKSLDNLRDSIKIERKADLALFRMEKNQLSQAIDVYASLVNQYNKAISSCSDDGCFSAMVKMAFWYHKLGRLRVQMDGEKKEDDAESLDSFESFNSMPLDATEHTKNKQGNDKKKTAAKSMGRSYLENAALWYRMALESFCTSIGRFDKISDDHSKSKGIDVTSHPTYQQLLLRLEQVFADHYLVGKRGGKQIEKNERKKSYLEQARVLESSLYHYNAKQAMKHHQRLNTHRDDDDSMTRLKSMDDCIANAKEGFSECMAIEKATWGDNHQIVVRLRHELSRANRLKDSLDLEISAFPAKQALKLKQEKEEEQKRVEEEKRKQKEKEQEQRQQKSPSGSVAGLSQPLKWLQDQVHTEEQTSQKDRSRAEEQSKTNKEIVPSPPKDKTSEKVRDLVNMEIVTSPPTPRRQHKKPKKQKPLPKKQQRSSKSPSGSIAGSGRIHSNGVETLRRLQDEVHQSQKLLEGHTAERDQLRAQLQAKTVEILHAMSAMARKEEEAIQWKRNCEKSESQQKALQDRILELEHLVSLSEQKQGQMEFTMKKEGVDLAQSATQKEVELEYWKQKFEAAQIEWNECQEELRMARTVAGNREAELIELRGKFDGEWKNRNGQVDRLREENERLQREVQSVLAERKQLDFSKQMNNIEFTQAKEKQVLDAMAKAAKSDSEAASWKRKYNVAQTEFLVMHDKSEGQAREAIADAALKSAELARWKKKFEIAQKEWMEIQTQAERQAMGAIATAKQYEASHTELAEKFTAAQKGLKSLLSQNKKLQKEVSSSQSKQDQMEFTLKKQAIDFTKMQETLNRKTAEVQVWKDQCQASQQAQRHFSHEMRLSRVSDGSMQDRIVDLLQQNVDLKERNRELQDDKERRKLELDAKDKEVALVKQAALKRIRELKTDRKQQNGSKPINEENTGINETVPIEDTKNIDLSDPSSLAAKLGRTQRALEYVEKDHKESLQEIESLTKARSEMEENIAEAQKIISLLKTANNERIEQCTKLENEKAQIQRKLQESLDERRQSKFYTEGNPNLQKNLDESIADKKALEAQVKALKVQLRMGKSNSGKEFQDLTDRISTLESDLQKAERRNGELQSELRKSRKWSRRDDTDSEESDSSNEDVEELTETISELRADLRVSELQNKELQSELKKLKLQSFAPSQKWSRRDDSETSEDVDQIKSLSNRCEQLERELCVSNHQVEDLKDQVREYASSDDGTRTSKQDFHDMLVLQDLERVVDKEKADKDTEGLNTDDKNKIKALSSRCEELERDLVIANHQIEDLQDEVREYREQGDSVGGSTKDYRDMILAQDIERKLEEANQIRDNLSSELSVHKEKVVKAEQKEKEYERKLDYSNKQIKSLRDSVRDFKRLSMSQHNDGKKDNIHLSMIEDLEEELEDSNEIREKLAAELKACKAKIKSAEQKEKEFQWLSKEYKQLEEKLEESNQIREEMATTLSSLKKRLARSGYSELEESSNSSDNEQQQRLVSKLKKELEDASKEKNVLKKHFDRVSEDLEDLEEENEELTKKYGKLEKQYKVMKQQSEQNTMSHSVMSDTEKKEQERIHQKCAKLEKDLVETSNRNKELESTITEMRKESLDKRRLEKNFQETSNRNIMLQSRVDEMRKRNIENLKLEADFEKISARNKELEARIDEMRKRNLKNLSDHSRTSCKQCLALGDELRSTIEQNEKHMQTTEKFEDDYDQLLDRYNFLEKELAEAMEQNKILESQVTTNESKPRDEGLDNDDKYQELNIRCIELEEELRDSKDLNDKKTAQLDALKTKIADLESYADDTAADLEQAESIIGALKAEGAGGGAEITLLLDRCNKLQRKLKEAQRAKEKISYDLENSQKAYLEMKEEMKDSVDDVIVNINVDNPVNAESDKEQALQELNTKLNEVTAAKEELEKLLKESTEEVDQQKRLKGHIEKDRDYLDKVYTECKRDMAKIQSDLDATKELLKKSNEEKEELERQLQIEKHVSQSLKASQKNQDADASEENELEELYRQARDELTEVEGMLFETEEELEALKSKYQKLQEDSKLPAGEREESELSGEINHDLQDLSRDELMVETKKALRKMQETQTKVVDLQETNMILQAQLKSSLNFQEKSKQQKQPVRRNRSGGPGGRGGGGFWSLGGGNAVNKTNDASDDNQNNGNPRRGPFFGFRGGARGGDASNEKGGENVAGDQ